MATTVTMGDGTVEVIERKAKPTLKAVPQEQPKAEVKTETVAKEAPDAAVDDHGDDSEFNRDALTADDFPDADEGDDASDGELSDRAKKIIAKQKRAIDKKHRAMREADELAREQFDGRKAAEKRAEDLAAEVAALKSQTAAAKEKTRADFKDDEEWINHLADRRVEAKELERKQSALKAEQESMEQARVARNVAFAKTVPDWEETTENLADRGFSITPAVEQYFYESDASAAILYHLGKNPDLYADIVKMKPTRAIKALGELEDRLVKPAKAEGKTLADKPSISRAPAPITPLSEGATPQQKDPQKMSTDEYLAYAAQRRREKARLGR